MIVPLTKQTFDKCKGEKLRSPKLYIQKIREVKEEENIPPFLLKGICYKIDPYFKSSLGPCP